MSRRIRGGSVRGLVLAVTGTVAMITTTPASAAGGDIESRISALEKEIADLRKAESEQAKVKADAKGFHITSPDGAFNLNVSGFAQVDGRYYGGEDTTSNDEAVVRRIRPTLRGQLGDRVGFRFTAEFADSTATLLDGYTDVTVVKNHQLRLGRFKGPVGLERLQSVAATTFAERSFPTELVPQRDLGGQLQGVFGGGVVSYAVGAYNGSVDGRVAATRNPDDKFELGARVFFEPWLTQTDSALKGLGFGLGGSIGEKEGGGNDFLPRYRAPAQETIFSYRATVAADGDHTRLSPQGYYYLGPFGLLGEYVDNELDVSESVSGASETITSTGWQVTASWVLTGEAASFNGVAPKADFGLSGGTGAIELALRLGELEIDDDAFPVFADPTTAVESARTLGVGLNWYLSRNAKAVLDWLRTDFDGGSAAGADRDDETLVVARFQYNI
jgi:phosphate-selective porin OprO/OprP